MALRLMRKLLRKHGFGPKVLVTDKLGSTAPPSGIFIGKASGRTIARKLASGGAPA